MREDEIMREIHNVKDEIAAQYNGNVHALAESLREDQKKSNRKIVRRTPKRISKRT
jgi:hypothetical protein